MTIGDPRTDLAISLLNADGTVGDRWGPDEAAVGSVPKGLGFTTSDPGGFKDSSLALSRAIDKQWPDLKLLRSLRIYGLGGKTAWEGRLQEIPLHHAEDTSISPGAVGHVARLDDDPSFAEIYLDSDLTKWGEPSIARKVALLAANILPNAGIGASFQDSSTSLLAAIMFSYERLSKNNTGGESWYYGNGVDIGRLLYNFKGSGTDVAWTDVATLCENDAVAGAVASADYNGVAESLAQQLPAAEAIAAAGKKYAAFSTWREQGATEVDPYNGNHRWEVPKVMGRHGLKLSGVWPLVGLLGSDVVADIVRRTAPDLKFTTGPYGTIPSTTFGIPHLVFSEGVKGSDAILGVNAFHQRTWGVYEDKTFFWRPVTSYRKRWRIRRSRGHGVDLLGPQAEDAINGVVVTFTDAAGMTRVVGPPGCPTAYATSSGLADTSASNPVNAAGIKRKWAELKLGFVTTTSGAIQVGGAYLADKLTNSKARGSVVVSGLVQDDRTGSWHPSWEMRAGDSAVVTDGDNVERGIIETNYNHDTRTCTCNMDTTPHKFEALQERMGIALMGVTE